MVKWAVIAGCILLAGLKADAAPFARLSPPDTEKGYLALLLVNETPFPGERGYVSEDNTRAAMLSVLWVLHSRIRHVPPGYTQQEIAATRSDNIIDVMTAGGQHGQCDGFYREAGGSFVAVSRVHERAAYLLGIANRGDKPGRFASLLTYAQGLADAYVGAGIEGADRYADLHQIGPYRVTGRAYSWMTDRDCYNPGGSFVGIPDSDSGSLGGNRFFTLRHRDP